MIRANVIPDRQDQSTTHYVAFSFQDNCLIPCWHQHNTIREAVASCIRNIDDTVKAFTDGRERPLTPEEQAILIRALKELWLEEKAIARRDDTTDVLNRLGFREVLGRERCAFREFLWYEGKRSRRYLRPLTVVYIDLDGFKRVNDTFGHDIGDEILKVVAATTQSTLREVDSVARLHGDEFALLLPDTGDARVVLEKLRKALKDAMKQHQWKVTFSIGAVTSKTPPTMVDYLINLAEKQMRFVKQTGKNRISYRVLEPDPELF